MVATLMHEAGHSVSLGAWGTDAASPAWQRWAAAAKSDGTSASRYANENPLEDFGETFVLFLATRGTPAAAEYEAIFPRRWALMNELMVGKG